ncbi:FG-GAP-like repeat-containing protein [Streptomyces axinellae]|uniref:FG-GAP-like repeat-containing protein n=1 Tax=Streptomyces axinellae TaxID=552788 RepID=A0ABN3Q4G7_9ACTN
MAQRTHAAAIRTVARVVGVSALVAGTAFAAVTSSGAGQQKDTALAAKGKAGKAAAFKTDFNGDGYADTVSSAPRAPIGKKHDAGFITISYGSAKGASTTHRQIFSANTKGVPGEATNSGRFGESSVARDFDGDGITDLALTDAGKVIILWGAKGKTLKSAAAEEAGVVVPGVNSVRALAAGDFNGDGKADLAVDGNGSKVNVLYGGFGRDGKPAKTSESDTGHEFGADKLISGDVTGDGVDDLVTTHSFEEKSEKSEFFKGTKDGLEAKSKPTDDAETGVIADVNKDGFGDLVIRTVPGGVLEDLPYDHGTLKVIYGTADGLGTKTTKITQNSPGVPGSNEKGDEFGKALAAGDVNGDGYADIAVGAPYEDIGKSKDGKDTGAVVLLLGGKKGLTGTGSQAFHQNTKGVPGAIEADDRFGSAVSLGDTDNDGHDDLAIGAPGEDGSGDEATDAGAVWVLRGSGSGLTTKGVISYGPKTLGAPEDHSALGTSFSH